MCLCCIRLTFSLSLLSSVILYLSKGLGERADKMHPEITLLSIKLIFPGATLTCCAKTETSPAFPQVSTEHLWTSRRPLAIICAWFKYIILDCVWIWRIVTITHFSYDPCCGNFRRASFLFRAPLSAGSLCHDPTFPSEELGAFLTRISFEQ